MTTERINRSCAVDKVDELIIAALKDDSRVSLAQLARQVHKSRTAVES
jgi:Lrp/AsnC family transcriptional regulator, leucine-responsive regulatory protein